MKSSSQNTTGKEIIVLSCPHCNRKWHIPSDEFTTESGRHTCFVDDDGTPINPLAAAPQPIEKDQLPQQNKTDNILKVANYATTVTPEHYKNNPTPILGHVASFCMGYKYAKAEPQSKESEDYWKARCLAAEKFISESPCDPDILPLQVEAHNIWQEIKKQQP